MKWRLYEEHVAAVRAYLRRRHRGVDTEDATQEVFMAAARAEPVGKPRAWLLTVARNVAATLGRKTVLARLEHEPASTAVNPRVQAMREAMNRLPADMLAALRMKLEEGLTYEEIAKRQGVPVGTVRSRLHRAVGMLREELKD